MVLLCDVGSSGEKELDCEEVAEIKRQRYEE